MGPRAWTLRALQILSFPRDGIEVRNGAVDTTIGGVNATPGGACGGDCNLISGNGRNGVTISGQGTMSTTVTGNYIGTDILGATANRQRGRPCRRGAGIRRRPRSPHPHRWCGYGGGEPYLRERRACCGPPPLAVADGGGIAIGRNTDDTVILGNSRRHRRDRASADPERGRGDRIGRDGDPRGHRRAGGGRG